ncbi:response regulator [Ferruginibacter sp. HRS2-29]|uniref:response regulator n=1 Tax=Ferruginibacter sp. HRS2-29 TaxID=2487334 RepID=UPI0020CE12EA|nr:response regulator [Ferruginibacter sp. HRS2-29]MCP9749655.1 response regulator [Ferruginibacter sp. HRS2-29]
MTTPEIELLLVEDSRNDAELTIRALQKNKIVNNILHLRDGAAALDFLFGTGEFSERNIRQIPRVVLLDLKMPKVDGLEVLRQIKSNALTKNIPVVVLTSSKEDPDIKMAYELGANSYIVKPVDFEGFSKAVGELGLYWMILNQRPQK